MSIPITGAFPLSDVPRRIPTRPHVATVWRWATRGIKGRRLETWLIGGKRVTTFEAIERFIEGLSANPADAPMIRIPRHRGRAIARAEVECEEAGL